MATIATTLGITSSTVSSSPINLSLAPTLTVGSPSLGISRSVATVITATELVPATAGTKYCFVSHTGKKTDGTTTSANTVTLSTITSAPVAQTDTLLFNTLFVANDVIKVTINGVVLEDVTMTGTQADTEAAVATAIANHTGILSAVATTGASSHSYAITGANPGDAYTITATCTSTGASPVAATVTAGTAASGSSFIMLRTGEFAFLPVKAGEGLQALAQGTSAAEGVMLEYAYWTKATE